jgi:membrane protease YdiL (CAAX protease family)
MDKLNLKTWKQAINSGLLVLLLIIRIGMIPIAHPMPDEAVPDWSHYVWYVGSFILISVFIGINRHNLSDFHIDRHYISIFVFAGILVSLYITPGIIGFVVTGIALGLFYLMFLRQTSLILPNDYWQKAAKVILFLIVLCLIFSGVNVGLCPNKDLQLASYFLILIGPVYEEVVFRGSLWALFRKLSFRSPTIIFLQAFVFWLAHIYYLSRPISFWLYTPLFGLLLGYIVFRTKSLFSSTLAHFGINLLIVLVRDYFCI